MPSQHPTDGHDPIDEPGDEGAAVHSNADSSDRNVSGRRRRRRASLPAPAGSDPHPYDPPLEPREDGENDERLRIDKPPHWS